MALAWHHAKHAANWAKGYLKVASSIYQGKSNYPSLTSTVSFPMVFVGFFIIIKEIIIRL